MLNPYIQCHFFKKKVIICIQPYCSLLIITVYVTLYRKIGLNYETSPNPR